MFGDIALDIISYSDYETAIVRHNSFRDTSRHFGAIRGEISFDRSGYVVKNVDGVVVGEISEDLTAVAGENCAGSIRIRRVETGTYIILNGSTPIGTISGRFPTSGARRGPGYVNRR